METKYYIAGVDRTNRVLDGTATVDRNVGARAVFRATVCDRATPPTYAPVIRQQLLVVDDERTGTASVEGGPEVPGGLDERLVTLTAGTFEPADVGKILQLPGAGRGGAQLHATIREYISPNTVRTNRFPYTTLSGIPARWGRRLFFGIVHTVGESAMVDDQGLLTPITGQDYGGVLDRVRITMEFPAGRTARQVLDDIAYAYWDRNGLFNDPDMSVGGPLLPELSFKNALGVDVCKQICTLANYVYVVGDDGVLYIGPPGTLSTPATLNTGNSSARLGASAETSVEQYANRVIVRFGTGAKEVTEALQGDGTKRVFKLENTPQSRPAQVYDNQAGEYRNVGLYGVDTLFEWVYRVGDNAIVQLAEAPPGTAHAALADGQSVTAAFVATFPATTEATDDDEIAAWGDWDMAIDAPDVFNAATAKVLAQSYLDNRYKRTPKRMKLETPLHGFLPGQRGAILSTIPAAAGLHLIESVRAYKVPDTKSGLTGTWWYEIGAIEGDQPLDTWLEWYQQGGGSSGASASAISVGAPLPPPPVTGASGISTVLVTIGGFTPDWFNAPAANEWFDAPGSVDIPLVSSRVGSFVTVQIHLAVSTIVPLMTIQPRLILLSTGAQRGIGDIVSHTTLGSEAHQSFQAVVEPGYQYYRLQFRCSVANRQFTYAKATVDNY